MRDIIDRLTEILESQELEEAPDEVRDAVRIEIDRRGTHVVAFDVGVGEEAHVGEKPFAI